MKENCPSNEMCPFWKMLSEYMWGFYFEPFVFFRRTARTWACLSVVPIEVAVLHISRLVAITGPTRIVKPVT